MTKPSEEAEATAGATKETDVAAKGIKPAKLTAIIIAAVVVALAGIGGGYAYWTHHEGNAYHEAVAPSGNVQLILDIFNKTGVPAYVSRLCSGGHTVVTQPRGRGRGTVRLACGQRGHARPMVAGAERIITGQ